MKILLLFLFLIDNSLSKGENFSFIIKIYPQKVQVSSPQDLAKELSVNVENMTLGPIWGKITDEENHVVEYLGIPSQQTRSVIIKNYKKDHIYYFVSQSPPFQSMILKFDKNTYQIPSLK